MNVIMNPERAKDFSDMESKLDRRDATAQKYEVKFDKHDKSDKIRQAAIIYGMAPNAMVESRLAGRRDLGPCEKISGKGGGKSSSVWRLFGRGAQCNDKRQR